jgi:flagellar biosynthesis chaperone FliJ
MPHEPLLTLLALRRRAVDESRRAVAACIQAETTSAQAIVMIDDAIRRERAMADTPAAGPADHPAAGRADHPAAGPADMDLFAAWLARARTRRRAAVAALAVAETQTALSRDALSNARTAADAVERLLAERAAIKRAREDAREAHALDDIARARISASGVRQPVD